MFLLGKDSGRETFFHEDTGLLVTKHNYVQGHWPGHRGCSVRPSGRRPLPAVLALSLSPSLPSPPVSLMWLPLAPHRLLQSCFLCVWGLLSNPGAQVTGGFGFSETILQVRLGCSARLSPACLVDDRPAC